jgi:hypothetical protein
MAGQGLSAAWWRDGPALPALTFGTGHPDSDPRAESVRRARLSVGAAPLLNDINRAIGGPLSRMSPATSGGTDMRRYGNGARAAIPTSPQLANIRLGKSGRLAVTNQFLG